MQNQESIIVLDYGSQYNQLICRRIREVGAYSELLPHDVDFTRFKSLNPKAIILSGGPASVYDKGAPKLPDWIFKVNLPIFGICYGMQLLAKALGGNVKAAARREYGPAKIKLTGPSPLFHDIQVGSCWMSHGDDVSRVPAHFQILAKSASGAIAAMGNDERKIYGVQFHPEVSHTPFGSRVLSQFLKISGCAFDWSLASFIEQSVADIKKKIGDQGAVCAVSGGVDSLVAALLVSRAIGNKLHAVFVDNGLLRHQEKKEVRSILSKLKVNFSIVDASDLFLKKLAGVSDPEKKRKIIGETFIRVFEEKAKSLPGIAFLVQGTLYPDVIESSTRESKLGSKIKTHHNVGGLPEKMGLALVEPLRYLFKDEVRQLGKKLGLAPNLINRQPFPGPGLAVRVIGDVNRERLAILQRADAVVREEVGKYKGRGNLWQFFAILLPLKTVGVMGDGRTYQNVAAIRAVQSQDGMTADWARLHWDLLSRMSSRIVSEVRGINRVVYDITSKPPATIEWE